MTAKELIEALENMPKDYHVMFTMPSNESYHFVSVDAAEEIKTADGSKFIALNLGHDEPDELSEN
jgi:hypothetical protein